MNTYQKRRNNAYRNHQLRAVALDTIGWAIIAGSLFVIGMMFVSAVNQDARTCQRTGQHCSAVVLAFGSD